MNEKVDPSNLKDYTEKTWFLGTDICEPTDLILLENSIGSSFSRDEGSIFYVGILKEPGFERLYQTLGYSPYFQDIMSEAVKRGYNWVWLDRDISSF